MGKQKIFSRLLLPRIPGGLIGKIVQLDFLPAVKKHSASTDKYTIRY